MIKNTYRCILKFFPPLIFGLLLFGLNFNQVVLAQEESKTIIGKVIDKETGEPLPFVNVVVKQDEKVICGVASDFDGDFLITTDSIIQHKPIQLIVTTVGYLAFKQYFLMQALIQPLNIKLKSSISVETIEVTRVCSPFDRIGETNFSREDIQRMPRN